MNLRRKTLLISLLVMLVVCIPIHAAHAFPPLPSSFYGTIKLNGSDVPDGTLVEALIGDQVFAEALTQTYQGESVYSIDIPGDDPSTAVVEGGRPGEVISFRVGGQLAKETGVWQSGTNINLDVTITSDQKLFTPQPSRTPMATQTLITYDFTASPTSTQSSDLSFEASSSKTPTASLVETEAAHSESNPAVIENVEAVHDPTLQNTGASSEDLSNSEQAVLETSSGDETNRHGAVNLWVLVPGLIILASTVGYMYLKKAHENRQRSSNLL